MALDRLGGSPHSRLLKRSAQVSTKGGSGANIDRETHPRRASGLARVGLGPVCMSPSPTSTVEYPLNVRTRLSRGRDSNWPNSSCCVTISDFLSRGNVEDRRSAVMSHHTLRGRELNTSLCDARFLSLTNCVFGRASRRHYLRQPHELVKSTAMMRRF